MLSAFVAALLVLAPPTESQQIPDAFEVGKEYFFNYEGYALSGRPPSRSYSGFKLSVPNFSVIPVKTIDKGNGLTMQLKMQDALYQQVSGDVSPVRPQKGDSPTLLTNDKALKRIPADFSQIVYFNWKEGRISGLMTSPEDPVWIRGLKKGIVNMFHFNLKNFSKENPTQMITWENEDGPEGNCKTGYMAKAQKNGFNLQKTRNLYNCNRNSNVKVFSPHLGQACAKDDSLYDTQLRGESHTTYDLSIVSNSRYFVRSAKAISQYFLPNPNSRSLIAGSYITQELKFVVVSNNPVVRPIKLRDDTVYVEVSKQKLSAEKKDSGERLRMIDTFLVDIRRADNNEKLNALLRDLVTTLRLASVNDLKYTLNQAKANGERVE